MPNDPTLNGPATHVEANFAARPRVEIARTAKGERTWRLSVVAQDDSPEAVRAALELSLELDRTLQDRFPIIPAS